MAERSKAAVLKTAVGETLPGVRIPLPPPRGKLFIINRLTQVNAPLWRACMKRTEKPVFRAWEEGFACCPFGSCSSKLERCGSLTDQLN